MKTKAITSKRAVLLTMMTLMLVVLIATPTAFALGESVELELTWGNDELWEMLAPVNSRSGNSNHKAHRPIYIIANVTSDPHSLRHPPPPAPLMIGAHDHVIPVPPKNKGTFTAIWHVFMVVPSLTAAPGVNVTIGFVDTFMGPMPFLTQADLDADGILEPEELLTSADKIEQAADLGLADIVDPAVFIGEEIVFVCPVRPIR